MGRSLAFYLKAKTLVIGHDIRLSGPSLRDAAVRGMRDMGTHVIDLGQCGTEMIYFAVAHLKADGGMMITASHNPAEYNGMKLVRSESRPISGDTGLKDLAAMVTDPDFETKYPKAARQEAMSRWTLSQVMWIISLAISTLKRLLPKHRG